MALTAMTAKDWRDSLNFSTQEARQGSLAKRFKVIFQFQEKMFLRNSRQCRLFFTTTCDMIHSSQAGGPTGMKDVVTHFKNLNGDKGWGEWEVDQVKQNLFAFFHLLLIRLFSPM